MDWKNYESVVRELIYEVSSKFPDMAIVENLRRLKVKRIAGASGFKHQIDVYLRTNRWLVLVECKYWKKPIGVREALVLAARAEDIKTYINNMEPERQVWVSLVTTRESSSNVAKLARHFGISLDYVRSINEYVLRLRDYVNVAQRDVTSLPDSSKIEVERVGESSS
jgi:hypothetical protein